MRKIKDAKVGDTLIDNDGNEMCVREKTKHSLLACELIKVGVEIHWYTIEQIGKWGYYISSTEV